uniref:Uncharacterized protein n=1 Tax=Candidatus Kentrum sp. DK TaxID=2126562 RepID=A0A450SXY0_9GAMM|nr:MAG: hypothetical protein BECKDK2373C_GA0170839_106829 [Candidatus Kentron sp. DK]
MHIYMSRFNMTQSVFEAKKRKAVTTEIYEAVMNISANISHPNRDFIEKHVFPRGYPQEFRDEIERLWREIDQDGLLAEYPA